MAISDKLTYLNETKTMFKDRLNSLGAEIISSTTFRNYLTYLDDLFDATWNKTDLSVNGIVGRTSQDGTPTPESPVPINSLSGDLTYKVSSKNIFDKNTMSERIYAYIPGENDTSWIYAQDSYSIRIPCQPSKTYTISANNSNESIFRAGVVDSDNIPTSNVPILMYSAKRYTNTNTPIVVTTGANAKYIVVQCGAVQITTTINTLMINEGTTALPYEPHISQSFPIGLKSRNLFNLTANDFKNGEPLGGARKVTLTLKPNTQYTLSSNEPTGTSLETKIWFNGNSSLYNGVGLDRPKTTTTDSNGNLFIAIKTDYIDTLFENYWIMLNEGTTALDYEPYYDIQLNKISTYEDKIYSSNGKFYLEKNIGETIIDDNYTWELNQTTTNYTQFLTIQTISDIASGTSNALTNYFRYHQGNPSSSTTYSYFWVFQRRLVVVIDNTIASDTTSMKNWATNHNIDFVYQLATPTTTEITSTNYPTLYNQLTAIQEYLIKYKISKEFILGFSSPDISY